ncbi:MAG: hypothetical protein KME23_03115 [Goleter apudmare HA4340-LM2]|jgi:chemotaxis regulatin CheY-phosphate phosphatase CheZ|nr:hypothetical protein [Goleter apudmare HA4340-LM2]
MSEATPDRLDRIERILEQTAQLAQQTAQLAQQTAQQQQQLTSRFDSLVSETQRLFNRLGEQQSLTSSAVESLSDAVTRLTQNAEADRVRWRETQNEIRQIWQYLLQQRGNGRGEG